MTITIVVVGVGPTYTMLTSTNFRATVSSGLGIFAGGGIKSGFTAAINVKFAKRQCSYPMTTAVLKTAITNGIFLSRRNMDFNEFVNRQFGEGDDTVQAKHINQIALALLVGCKYNESNVEGQLCYVAGKLDKHGDKFIETLAEFIRMRKEHA